MVNSDHYFGLGSGLGDPIRKRSITADQLPFFELSSIDQTCAPRSERVKTEQFASETNLCFVCKSCLSVHATRSSTAAPGKPRMAGQ
jgi:hypothetical protein